MTVHVLIPVFNRLAMTCRLLSCLQAQQVDEALRLIVIDDGSTDGTGEYLISQQDITVLKGGGSLWWGGAIQAGLKHVLSEAEETDWVLLVNNDTHFENDFVQSLLDVARAKAPAAVGSVIYDAAAPDHLLSIGAVIDSWRLQVEDKLNQACVRDPEKSLYAVDALSGRCTLYPLEAFRAAGIINPTWLPHYLADYELSVRVRKAGFKLLVSKKAAIFSENEWGNEYQPHGLREKYFSIRSAYYLPAILAFWWRVSTLTERLTLLPRLIFAAFRKP